MKKLLLLVVLASLVLVSGCFGDKKEEVDKVSQLKEKVEAFATAANKRDTGTIVLNGIYYLKSAKMYYYDFDSFIRMNPTSPTFAAITASNSNYFVYKDKYIGMKAFFESTSITAESFINGTNGVLTVTTTVIPDAIIGIAIDEAGVESLSGVVSSGSANIALQSLAISAITSPVDKVDTLEYKMTVTVKSTGVKVVKVEYAGTSDAGITYPNIKVGASLTTVSAVTMSGLTASVTIGIKKGLDGEFNRIKFTNCSDVLGANIVTSSAVTILLPIPALTGITVTGLKTTYLKDEVFSTTSASVVAAYSNNTTKAAVGYSVTSVDTSTAGVKPVTISYMENGVTKTAAFNITVLASAPTITVDANLITGPFNKIFYMEYNIDSITVSSDLIKSIKVVYNSTNTTIAAMTLSKIDDKGKNYIDMTANKTKQNVKIGVKEGASGVYNLVTFIGCSDLLGTVPINGCESDVTLPFTQATVVKNGVMIPVAAGTTSVGNGAKTMLYDFEIAQYEVIQQDFKARMATFNPSSFVSDAKPVEGVTWFDAVAYCNALSAYEGLVPYYSISNPVKNAAGTITSATVVPSTTGTPTGYRLPTQDEWEFAARGGTSGSAFTYVGSNTIEPVAWYYANSLNLATLRGATQAVGTKAPNNLLIYDMSGNVAEWTDTLYDTGKYVVRGGAWNDNASACVTTYIKPVAAITTSNAIGFRVVKPNYTQVAAATQVVAIEAILGTADYAKLNTDTTAAQTTVTALPASTTKTLLQAKLDLIKETVKVVKAEEAAKYGTAVTAQNGADTITLTAHGLANGTAVAFTATTMPTGLTAGTTYYVISTAANTFQVSLTVGGGAATFTDDGTALKLISVPTATVDYNAAITSVSASSITATAKTDLQNRLKAVGATIDVLIAEAETTSTAAQTAYTAANTTVTALTVSLTKTDLQNRLKIVDAEIAVMKAEEATATTTAAITTGLLATAQTKVTGLPAGTVKTALQDKIDVVKAILQVEGVAQGTNANLITLDLINKAGLISTAAPGIKAEEGNMAGYRAAIVTAADKTLDTSAEIAAIVLAVNNAVIAIKNSASGGGGAGQAYTVFITAGVTGVPDLATANAVNAVIATLLPADVNTTLKIQAVVAGVSGKSSAIAAIEAANTALLASAITEATLNTAIGSTAVTATNGADTIGLNTHGFLTGTPVVFSATTMPAGLTAGTTYYVVAPITANDFKIAATIGGTAIDFTTNGTAVTLVNQAKAGNMAGYRAKIVAGVALAFDTATEIKDMVVAVNNAVAKISKYAEDGVTPPTLTDYQNAGITAATVDESNLKALNKAVLDLTGVDVDTTEKIQVVASQDATVYEEDALREAAVSGVETVINLGKDLTLTADLIISTPAKTINLNGFTLTTGGNKITTNITGSIVKNGTIAGAAAIDGTVGTGCSFEGITFTGAVTNSATAGRTYKNCSFGANLTATKALTLDGGVFTADSTLTRTEDVTLIGDVTINNGVVLSIAGIGALQGTVGTETIKPVGTGSILAITDANTIKKLVITAALNFGSVATTLEDVTTSKVTVSSANNITVSPTKTWTLNGNVSGTATVTIAGTGTIVGSGRTISGDVSVGTAATLSGGTSGLTITGNVGITAAAAFNKVIFSGAAKTVTHTLAGAATFTGCTFSGNVVNALGNPIYTTAIAGNVTTSNGTPTYNGAIGGSVSNTLGAATYNGAITGNVTNVSGNATYNGAITGNVQNTAGKATYNAIGGTLTVTAGVPVLKGVITGATTLNGAVDFNGATTTGLLTTGAYTLTVNSGGWTIGSGGVTATAAPTIAGTGTITGSGVTITGDLILSSAAKLTGATGALTITGDVTISAPVTLTNVTFSGTTKTVTHSSATPATFTNCVFSGNVANNAGAPIYTTAIAGNVTVTGPTAPTFMGAIGGNVANTGAATYNATIGGNVTNTSGNATYSAKITGNLTHEGGAASYNDIGGTVTINAASGNPTLQGIITGAVAVNGPVTFDAATWSGDVTVAAGQVLTIGSSGVTNTTHLKLAAAPGVIAGVDNLASVPALGVTPHNPNTFNITQTNFTQTFAAQNNLTLFDGAAAGIQAVAGSQYTFLLSNQNGAATDAGDTIKVTSVDTNGLVTLTAAGFNTTNTGPATFTLTITNTATGKSTAVSLTVDTANAVTVTPLITQTGVTASNVETTAGVTEVLPASKTIDGGLTIAFGAGTGATLNTCTFILGTIANTTPTTATYAGGAFTINGDFNNTATAGMALLADIQTALRGAAGAPAGAAFITVTGPVVEFTGSPTISSAVAGGVTAVAEVNTLTITAACTATGTIGVTFSDGTINKTVDVPVVIGDTTSAVATKIRTAMAADTAIGAAYTVTNDTTTSVRFAKNATGAVTTAISVASK